MTPRLHFTSHKLSGQAFELCQPCVTHQADQLPVKPAHDVWPLLRLGPEDSQAGHEHRGGFLVERGLDVLNL